MQISWGARKPPPLPPHTLSKIEVMTEGIEKVQSIIEALECEGEEVWFTDGSGLTNPTPYTDWKVGCAAVCSTDNTRTKHLGSIATVCDGEVYAIDLALKAAGMRECTILANTQAAI